MRFESRRGPKREKKMHFIDCLLVIFSLGQSSPMSFRGWWANIQKVDNSYLFIGHQCTYYWTFSEIFYHSNFWSLLLGGSSTINVGGSSITILKKNWMPLRIMVCARGYMMNSCACLLDPKYIFMCVVLVWWFGDGCFCEWIYNFFFVICNFEHIFSVCKFVKVW
jgi:hypothetical protein